MLCIKNGLIHDAVNREAYKGDILVENGKISAIGRDISVTEGTEIIDAEGLQVYPGFVEAHCHLGLDNYACGFEGDDYNEMTDIICPQLHGCDGIYPQDPTLKMAAEGGVTCVATGPGSANVLGGTFVAIKTVGKRVDKMIVKDPIAMKCAFGENPKRCYCDKSCSCRMDIASKLRETLKRARDYMERKEMAGEDISKRPVYDPKLEALIPVLKKEIPLKAHAHRADDIFSAIRVAKECDVRLTLEHVTDGSLIAEELAEENYPVAVGPTFGHATKLELINKSFETPGILAKAGCQVSIITDSPVIPQQYLALCAGFAVQSGMDEFDALKAITINPARHIGVDNRVGSLEVGKDADIVIADGSPLISTTRIVKVLIDGNII
ncbi:amidohydrolase [Coprococcus sp. AF21-14LB]|uniref:amidohydrolase n=1 Tax=Coprococcus sp. AF21-14LB TaxID=2292231 RepID=UPI000E4F7BA1|nr:amidohydrolase [Coprococcus sp. AF21-14LB]RGS79704.1 amidohydrolase [Coprococcus sp. AF21-14LB]